MGILAALILGLALLHTLLAPMIARIHFRSKIYATVGHLLSEVELIFGLWALILLLMLVVHSGASNTWQYVRQLNFTEPLFVWVVMLIAATSPILLLSKKSLLEIQKRIPLEGCLSFYFVLLGVLPLLGSLITEPAAMTLGALLLSKEFFSKGLSSRCQYRTLGVLFVNVSIGGTLTPFAAPPVLMVAHKWGWDTGFMLTHFGWKSILAILLNAGVATLLSAQELRALKLPSFKTEKIQWGETVWTLGCLAGVVWASHYALWFLTIFTVFVIVYPYFSRYHRRGFRILTFDSQGKEISKSRSELRWRESTLVGIFLAGLVVLGGQQSFWLEPLLMGMSAQTVFWGALLLTALTDNAALTYLGSLVSGLSPAFQYSLVAGAVAGGGLSVIANAPNPAGVALLKGYFPGKTVSHIELFKAAVWPTLMAICFLY